MQAYLTKFSHYFQANFSSLHARMCASGGTEKGEDTRQDRFSAEYPENKQTGNALPQGAFPVHEVKLIFFAKEDNPKGIGQLRPPEG